MAGRVECAAKAHGAAPEEFVNRRTRRHGSGRMRGQKRGATAVDATARPATLARSWIARGGYAEGLNVVPRSRRGRTRPVKAAIAQHQATNISLIDPASAGKTHT